MTVGRRWFALDADMLGKPFTLDLLQEFGWAGFGTWVAFLCACKRSRIPGSVRFISEADARAQLGLLGLELVDNQGKEWTLDDFWLFTGRKKQTKRTRRGREMNVTSTHWQRWQEDSTRAREAERMRRSRARKRPVGAERNPNSECTNVRPDLDLDLDSDITPNPMQGAAPPAPLNSRTAGTNPRARGTNPRAIQQEAERTPVPEWQEDEPNQPGDLRAALDAIEAIKDNLGERRSP